MTIPKVLSEGRERLTDFVRQLMPVGVGRMTDRENAVAIHLRGNEKLYQALTSLISSRVEGRARLPEPSDPLVCKSMMARDKELQWLLSRLEFIYTSPASPPADRHGEPPA